MLNGKIDRDSCVPLYVQLSDIIRDYAKTENALREKKLPTEFELAKMFSISRVTVTHALDILESEQLISRIKNRGTFYNSVLGSFDPQSKQRTIGAIFPSVWEPLEQDIKEAAEKYGFRFLCKHFLTSDLANEESELKRIVRQCAGIILHPSGESDDKALLKSLIDTGYPVVFFGSYYHDLPCNSVSLDHFETAYRIAERILAAGAKAPCLVASKLQMTSFRIRALGFTEALRAHAVKLPKEATFRLEDEEQESFGERFIQGGFDSVLAVTDTHLKSLLNATAFRRFKRIPLGVYSMRIAEAPSNFWQCNLKDQRTSMGVSCVDLLVSLLRSPGMPNFRRISIMHEIADDDSRV